MSIWIDQIDAPGDGKRVAVKGVIDVAGVPTTAGSRLWTARHPQPAALDAAVVGAARKAGYRVVGTTTLHELANGVSGINQAYGTPTNPRDPALVPGGSSSGAAVAVAVGEADLSIGTDTGGSVRIPAACCGVAGLKTTMGRVSREGIVPLAPSLDTVGLLAATVTDLADGLRALDPAGFDEAAWSTPSATPLRVGRFRPGAEPSLEDAVDKALSATGWTVEDVELPGFSAAADATFTLLLAESAGLFGWMLAHPDQLGEDTAARLAAGAVIGASRLAVAYSMVGDWREELATVFEQVDVIALPTVPAPPPTYADAEKVLLAELTRPANLAGIPALAVPLPGEVGASLQLLGPADADERLLAAGLAVERALSQHAAAQHAAAQRAGLPAPAQAAPPQASAPYQQAPADNLAAERAAAGRSPVQEP